MNQLTSKGIVLTRTDYGEADRIITLLTPEAGKLRLMARGVRKQKSKLAGGIELFSVSDVTYIHGRGAIQTLISARLLTHFGNIVSSIERVQLGYELLKMLNKATEDQPEPEYFDLLQAGLHALDQTLIGTKLIQTWFEAQLLRLSGHSPNLHTDVVGNKLVADAKYSFDFESMSFASLPDGLYSAAHIKTLRLLFSHHQPEVLHQVQGIEATLQTIAPMVSAMRTTYIRT
ncbi:MAG: DNA repair protein RecO [Patescibacteria group bacterium]|nr:DNA repair protein RecO [Patescibacteria group bacterium]